MESAPITNEEKIMTFVKSINDFPISIKANTNKPILSGFLLKEGRFIKSWNKRYFELIHNGIYYFENEKSQKNSGVIVLKPTSLLLVDLKEINKKRKNSGFTGLFGYLEKNNANQNTFAVISDSYSDKFKENRILVLTAQSEEEKENWVKNIRKIIEELKIFDAELEEKDPIKKHYLDNKEIPKLVCTNTEEERFTFDQFEAIRKNCLGFFLNKGRIYQTYDKYGAGFGYEYGKSIGIESNPLIEYCIKVKMDALHFAAILGRTNFICYFIKKCGANVELKSEDGSTALHYACLSGYLMTVKYLIEECNANVEAKDNNDFTPLHLAVQSGYLYIVKYLINERKANIEQKTKEGCSIIDLALINKKENVYKYLTEKLKMPNNIGLALIQAAKLNNLELLKNLYEKEKIDPNKSDNKGMTPIFFAAYHGNLEMFNFLINVCKASTDIKMNNGLTLLQFALEGKNFDIIKYIVEKCNPDFNIKNDKNLNVFHSAVISENIEILKYIWDKFPNKKLLLEETIEENGVSPFHNSIALDQQKMVEFFIEKCQVKLNVKTKKGYSIMAFTAKYGTANMLRFFNVNYELDFNEIMDKRHIVFLSVENGNLDSLKFFLDENDIDPNIRDEKGWTPIHVASYFGHLNIVKYLVEEKYCTAHIKENNGFTPAMLANQEHHQFIVKYLVDKFGTLKVSERYIY